MDLNDIVEVGEESLHHVLGHESRLQQRLPEHPLQSLHVPHVTPLRVEQLVDDVLALGLAGAEAGQLGRSVS